MEVEVPKTKNSHSTQVLVADAADRLHLHRELPLRLAPATCMRQKRRRFVTELTETRGACAVERCARSDLLFRRFLTATWWPSAKTPRYTMP